MRVLIVEDNADIAANIIDYLEVEGFSPDRAGDAGNLTTVLLHDLDRRLPEHPRPAVVAEPRPERQHLLLRRRRERPGTGEPRHEPLEVGDHRFHLGLLHFLLLIELKR